MRIIDRRCYRPGGGVQIDVDDYPVQPPTIASISVEASDEAYDDSGLLDAQGRPLGRARRGPGFGIYC